MEMWEIYNYTYGDVCSDSWFGKEGKHYHIGFINGTEDDVKSLVAELNANRNSYWPKREPEDDYDYDFEDANYIAYSKVKISSLDEIKNHYMCK